MGTITFVVTLILLLSFFIITWKIIKKEWFRNLKKDDVVSVTIYSENCQCEVGATVVNPVDDDDTIEVRISKENLDKCRNCAEIKGYNDKGEMTCWYNVKFFKSCDVR